MGGFHGEKEPRKATYANADAIKDIRHRLSYVSRRSLLRLTVKSMGFSAVELATPKGTKQSSLRNE